jgi:hypothetical protein
MGKLGSDEIAVLSLLELIAGKNRIRSAAAVIFGHNAALH